MTPVLPCRPVTVLAFGFGPPWPLFSEGSHICGPHAVAFPHLGGGWLIAADRPAFTRCLTWASNCLVAARVGLRGAG